MAECKLNLGSGASDAPGWIHIDLSLGAVLAKIPGWRQFNRRVKVFQTDWPETVRICDLTKPLPFPTNSVDAVYSAHCLEHFTKTSAERIVAETFRVLKPGGVLRLLVPDSEGLLKSYADGKIDASDLLYKALVVQDTPPRLLRAPQVSDNHLCLYDHKSVIRLLERSGFRPVEVCQPFQGRIENLEQIESPKRVLESVIVEGVVP